MIPTGYTLVLPPGWVRIPVRTGTREALEEKVFRGIEVIPDDVPRDRVMAYRAHVRRKVERMVGQARRAGGLDLYVPARARRATAASFFVAEVTGPTRERGGEDPGRVLEQLAAGPRAGEPGELRTVGQGVAVRWEYVRPPDAQDAVADRPSRHVDYVFPVPGDDTRWLAVSHATAGDGDPAGAYARALTDLFDALMTTFRWTL